MVVLAVKLCLPFPSFPRLVVISMTPFAPFTPNTAVETHGFQKKKKTEIFSSRTDIHAIHRALDTASTNISGSLLFTCSDPEYRSSGLQRQGFPVKLRDDTRPGFLSE